MSIHVVTDSTSYIPLELRKELDISVVSLSVIFDTDSYLEESLSHDEFFQRLKHSKKVPTSSQPAAVDFYKVFEQQVKESKAVVGVFISSLMSGTFTSALTAKQMVLEKYPSAQIELVDSRSNCMELGFAVLAAARAAQGGAALSEVVAAANQVIATSRFLFTPDTLAYLKKGGRIGGASALLGSLLQIKPILTVVDGKTEIFTKVRTKAKAISTIADTFLKDVEEKGFGDGVIHHIDNQQEGLQLAEKLSSKLGRNLPLCPIGPVVGLHVGPGSLGIAYYTKK